MATEPAMQRTVGDPAEPIQHGDDAPAVLGTDRPSDPGRAQNAPGVDSRRMAVRHRRVPRRIVRRRIVRPQHVHDITVPGRVGRSAMNAAAAMYATGTGFGAGTGSGGGSWHGAGNRIGRRGVGE